MEFFGKDIGIDLDDKQEKMLTYGVILIIAIALTYFLIVKPSLEIKANKEFYESEIARHEVTKGELAKTQKKHDLQVKKYEEQKDNYEKLLVKMENASLKNNAILKQMVQRLMDETEVKMLSIGAIEKAGTIVEESYEKRFVPYTVSGKGRNLAKLFFYLENSEWLITLRGSIINLKRSGSGENESVGAQFKLGAYYPKEGQPKEE